MDTTYGSEEIEQLAHELSNVKFSHSKANSLCESERRTHRSKPPPSQDTCWIMTLPTELRLMILRYLFPELVVATNNEANTLDLPWKLPWAPFYINRQIHSEASSIMYDETVFEVILTAKYIRVGTRTLDLHKEQLVRGFPQDSIRRIKHLKIRLHVGRCSEWEEDSLHNGSAFSIQDVEICGVRENVRKFVNFIGKDTLNTLSVETLFSWSLDGDRGELVTWSLEEYTQVLLLVTEPLKALGSIEKVRMEPTRDWLAVNPLHCSPEQVLFEGLANTKRYISAHDKWIQDMKSGVPCSSGPAERTKVETTYGNLVETIRSLNGLQVRNGLTQTASSFDMYRGLWHPLYLAQAAYESSDIESLHKICDVIKKYWEIVRQEYERAFHEIGQAFNDMSLETESSKKSGHSTRMQNLGAYHKTYVYGVHNDDQWEDLEDVYSKVHLIDVDTLVGETELRYLFEKDGIKWMKLKTPRTVRLIEKQRLEKEKSQQQ